MTEIDLASRSVGSVPSAGAGPAGAQSAVRFGAPVRAPAALLAWIRTHRPNGAVVALIPFLGFVGLFLLWPTAVVFFRALTPGGALGTSALMRAVSGPYRSAFENSLMLSAATAVIGGVLGLLLALAVRGLERPAWLRPALDAWSSVASQLGGVPLAFAFIAAIGTQGVVTKVLAAVGIDIVGSGFSLSTLAGMAPILLPSTLGGMLLLFINSFSAYATAYVLSSSGQLVPLQIRFVLQGNVITGEQDLGYALVVWTVLLLLAGLGFMSLLQRRAARWSRA